MRHQNHQTGYCPTSTRGQLLLSTWIGSLLFLNLGAVTTATAEDLVIPQVDAETTAPSGSEAVPPAPESSPENIPAAPLPEAPAADPLPQWATPEAAAPEPEGSSSAGSQPEVHVDASENYNLGATEPYTPPEEVVVSERKGGCQASIAPGQAIASNLCGTALTQQAQAPAPAAPSAWREPAPGWTDSQTYNAEAPAQDNFRWRSVSVPTVRPLKKWVIKPITGANPLKWILANGERMIFPLPIPVDITSFFGMRNHPILGTPRFHSGIDLGAPMGTPVLAAYSGRVSLAEFLGGYGLSVLLDHDGGQQSTQYAHLSELFVKPGQWVQQGTVIGLVGSTGQSTGPHLHFELQQMTKDGKIAVDPAEGLQMGFAQLVQALQTARITPVQSQQIPQVDQS
jgi:hypothetical protein